jgi:hypothetical protein
LLAFHQAITEESHAVTRAQFKRPGGLGRSGHTHEGQAQGEEGAGKRKTHKKKALSGCRPAWLETIK